MRQIDEVLRRIKRIELELVQHDARMKAMRTGIAAALRKAGLKNVSKSADNSPSDYQERILELEKRLRAVVEEHRRMRRALENLEERDPYDSLLRGMRSLPRVDDDARN